MKERKSLGRLGTPKSFMNLLRDKMSDVLVEYRHELAAHLKAASSPSSLDDPNEGGPMIPASPGF